MSLDRQITLKQLRAFVAVYRYRKLATAAEFLSVTQSAVSVLLRQLETTLNTTLFDRSTRSLEPTAAADELIATAERVLRDIASVGKSFDDLSRLKRGRVQLAVPPSVGSVYMPDSLRRFQVQHPEIQVVIDDCAPEQFLPRILGERVEMGIGTPERLTSEIEVRTIDDDYLCVVCLASDALAEQHETRWEQLQGVPIIGMRGNYGIRSMVDNLALQAGVVLNIVNEVTFATSAMWMAASGLGVAILPSSLAAHSHYENLTSRPLVAPRAERPVYVVTKKGRSLSAACERFIEVLQATIAARKTRERLNRDQLFLKNQASRG